MCPYVNEGLKVYCAKRAVKERRHGELWSEKWSAVWMRGLEIMLMLDDSVGLVGESQLLELVVELDDEKDDSATLNEIADKYEQ